jgi:hypothetical protein
VPIRSETVPLCDLRLDLLDLPTLELDDPPTFQTDQMLVNRLLRKPVLIPLESLSKVMLDHQPAPDQQIQGAVDRSFSDSVAGFSQANLDVFHGKVFGGREHDLGNRLPLMGDG